MELYKELNALYEELRAIAMEHNVTILSATQSKPPDYPGKVVQMDPDMKRELYMMDYADLLTTKKKKSNA